MIITQYTNPPHYEKQESPVTAYIESCEKLEPKPLFCELPDSLKIKADNAGTASTYTYTSSQGIKGASRGTSTSTTTTI